MSVVYLIRNTANGKCYIGQTTQAIKKRWHQHCADARTHSYPLHCAIRKYGPDAFTVSELGTADSQDALNRMEIEMIAAHNSADREYGYNVRAGGNSGGKLSAETRQKIAAKHRGRVAHNKGQRLAEPQRSALIRRMKTNHPRLGTHLSDETKAKIGGANRVHMMGRKQSATSQQKRSESLLRYYANPEVRKQLHLSRLRTWQARKEAMSCQSS